MRRLVFLLEERSMKEFLDRLLPRAFPRLDFLCVPHEGKQDLEKSIPRKLRAWNEPGVKFIVIRDNDGAPCKKIKSKIQKLCTQSRHSDTLVRIACQELEAWYLGEPMALAAAFQQPNLKKISNKPRYNDPDVVKSPSAVLERMIPSFQKISAARRMGEAISTSEKDNHSCSYQNFLSGVRQIMVSLKYTPQART